MKIKKLTKKHSDALETLIKEIEKNLVDKRWWLPINEVSRDNFLNDEWCYFLGLFDKKKLVGASCLFFNKHEYEASLKLCRNTEEPVAEIGRCMVAPKYRGHNYLYKLNKKLMKIAKKRGIKNIIATIHPENKASLRSFAHLNVKLQAKTVKNEIYERNIYTIAL